jgi:hypothetical protein
MTALRTLFLLSTLTFLWGCGEEAREYEVRENTSQNAPAKAAEPKGHVHRPYDFDLPKEWKEKDSTSGMRLLSFSDSTGSLDGSLVVLGKQASDLPSNINRWREQIGLSKISDEECLKSLGEGMSKLGNFKTLHIKGPEGQGILAGVFLLGEKVLFAKMMGPSAQTSTEEGRFIAFCTSLRAHTH